MTLVEASDQPTVEPTLPAAGVDRHFPTAEPELSGLSSGEVAERVSAGQTNRYRASASRSYGDIVRANVFTRFNALLGALVTAMLVIGPLQDALFGIVPTLNALIGIIQEARAKRTLDRLSLLSAPRAHVVRDGTPAEILDEDVVLDDVIEIRAGDQVAADGTVLWSLGLEVDESLLTGESEAVDKTRDEKLLSGSFAVAGRGFFRATAVGPQAYARKLASEAKRFTLVRSELTSGINGILAWITWILVPVAAVLLVSQLHSHRDWRDAFTGTTAGLVAMVPQGLVLLTSIAFGVAALTLARRNVLVQQLQAVEGLARVDVVCFDKTGTITDGHMTFDQIKYLDEDQSTVDEALHNYFPSQGGNATGRAIGEAFPPRETWHRTQEVPFSSARKWSGVTFEAHGSWILGAPEMIISQAGDPSIARAGELAGQGLRVVLLAYSELSLVGETLPRRLYPKALLTLRERVRADAATTLAYLTEQGVQLKILSGDSPATVGAVAKQVGLGNDTPVDARDLPDNDQEALGKQLERDSVFGRVSPRQKQEIVTALQARGHTVAMTGDGVNDVLAVKLADLGIALGSGAAATRAVAPVVLLDGKFAHLPEIMAEGRRVAANIERVANLFITKTVWATMLAVSVGIALLPYPFLPRHISIVDSLAIGIPAFFLALAPNHRRYVPGFVRRVLMFSIPAGFVVGASILAASWIAVARGLSTAQQETASVVAALIVSLAVLASVGRPLTWRRLLLIGAMALAFPVLFTWQAARAFFGLEVPVPALQDILLVGGAGAFLIAMISILSTGIVASKTA